MSTEPTGTTGKYNPCKHLNLKVTKNEWCLKYLEEGLHCRIDQNWDRSLCIYCKYRKPLDIYQWLEDYERVHR